MVKSKYSSRKNFLHPYFSTEDALEVKTFCGKPFILVSLKLSRVARSGKEIMHFALKLLKKIKFKVSLNFDL